MTVTIATIIPAVFVTITTPHLEYTSTSAKTIIDKCTLTNTDVGVVVASIYLEGNGAVNEILPDKSIAANEVYACPEIVGQVLESGDTLYAVDDTGSKLILRASGRIIT